MGSARQGRIGIQGHIFLIGFSGSGKSTVGPLLARKLRRRFIDTDALIEERSRQAITEIFERRGEKHFRKLETRIVKSVAASNTAQVIGLGGGAFQSDRNREVIRKSGIVVYLRTSKQEIYRRLKRANDRPLLRAMIAHGETLRTAQMRTISTLLSKRKPVYETADIQVSTTNKEPGEVANLIMQRLRTFHANRTR